MRQKHLTILQEALSGTQTEVPYWLKKLILQGPEPDRLQKAHPPRIQLTGLLAWWSKYAGLTEEQARAWLMPFCTEVLSTLSNSGPSAIRHGTKSMTRYVYSSEYHIDFASIDQKIAASSSEGPPYYQVYLWLEEKLREIKNQDAEVRKQRAQEALKAQSREKEEKRKEKEARAAAKREGKDHKNSGVHVSVKDRFKEQFEQAMVKAEREREGGVPFQDIVSVLNEEGFRTRTGRRWTTQLLRVELNRRGKRR